MHCKSVYTLFKEAAQPSGAWYTLDENSTHEGVLKRFLCEFFYYHYRAINNFTSAKEKGE